MSWRADRVVRLLLYLYPKSFRAEYGDEIVQFCADRQRHEGKSAWRIIIHETRDACFAGTTMRWEQTMTRNCLLAGGLVLGAVAAAAGGPFLAVPLGIVVLAGSLAAIARRSRLPIGPASPGRRWVSLGAITWIPGMLILITSDRELSAPLWSGAALSLVGGVGLVAVGLLAVIAPPPHAE